MTDIRLIGLPTDINSSFERGTALAPAAIRAALFSNRGNMSCESGAEIGVDITLHDLGDLALCEDVAIDDALIRDAAETSVKDTKVPIFLGGDHSVTFPIIKAMAAIHGPINILHFDAHPDTYHDFEGNPRSHASPFARIMEAGLAVRLVQVGIRTLTRHCREQAERFGIETIEMRNFAPERVPALAAQLYISLDIDGIDPAFASGVSHPESGGLMVREVLSVFDRIKTPIIGADIVELNPHRDVGDVTAILAAKFVREIAALIHRNAA